MINMEKYNKFHKKAMEVWKAVMALMFLSFCGFVGFGIVSVYMETTDPVKIENRKQIQEEVKNTVAVYYNVTSVQDSTGKFKTVVYVKNNGTKTLSGDLKVRFYDVAYNLLCIDIIYIKDLSFNSGSYADVFVKYSPSGVKFEYEWINPKLK